MEQPLAFIKNRKDIFGKNVKTSILQNNIKYVSAYNAGCFIQQPALLYLNSFTSLLVLSGTVSLNINYKKYNVGSDTLVLLSSSNLFSIDNFSPDFRCESLIIGKEYLEEINCQEMSIFANKYFGDCSLPTIISLSKEHQTTILDRFMTIGDCLTNIGHLYYNQVVCNRVTAFFLDLTDIVELNSDTIVNYKMTRYEQLTSLFIELLTKHYRSEHNVDFYAEKLHITPHYLTLVLKQTSNFSANELIFEMLYSEARLLLKQPKISIQDVANRLYFSDQSSFGKFFKRKSGMSPIEYKKV